MQRWQAAHVMSVRSSIRLYRRGSTVTIIRPLRRLGRGAARHTTIAVGIIAAGTLAADRADAAGFQVRENSAALLGTAFAGLNSDPRDLSTVWNNPAGMTSFDRSGAEAVFSAIWPRTEFTGTATDALGRPITGSEGKSDDPLFVPAAYLMWAPENSPFRFGLAATVPYGLETDYDEEWIGRYSAIKSKLETANIALTAAWEPLEGVSLGWGVSYQRAEAELTNAVDFGAILASRGVPGFLPTGADGRADVQGDDWSWGYTLGILVEPVEGTRFGMTYHSKIDHVLDGTASFEAPAPVRNVLTAAGIQAFAPETDASAFLSTPETLEFSLSQEFGAFGIHGTAAWTNWSSFEEIRIRFANPAQPDAVDEQFYEDTWFLALGGTWQATETLGLRAGVAFDERASQAEFRTPRIPDEARTWVTAGVTWQPLDGLTLDAGYAHLFVKDAGIDIATGTGNRLTGEFDNKVDILSVSARYVF